MQYRDIPILKKASSRTKIGNWIKALIFLVIIVFIYFKIREHPIKFDQVQRILDSLLKFESLYILVVLLFLTLINWFLEALKWQLLVGKIEKINILKSIRSVLSGLSMGFVTPHAIGDYAGRIWQLSGKNRTESLGAIMLGRAAQYFATFTFGLFGTSYLLFYKSQPGLFFICSIGLVSLSLVAGVSMFLFFRIRFIRILEYGRLRKLKKYFKIIVQYSFGQIGHLLALSFLRYIVFGLQFFLLLSLFLISSDYLLLIAGVTWTLFAKSTIPSFNFLSDLGVREFSALFFFSYYGADNTMVLLASFTLWCFNILIPALVGLAGIVKMKIFSRS